jgi:hypothetical protein
MTKTPITLQDLRRRLYVKAKAEPSWRFLGLYVRARLQTRDDPSSQRTRRFNAFRRPSCWARPSCSTSTSRPISIRCDITSYWRKWPASVAERSRLEVGLENRFQDEFERTLDHPVADARNRKLAYFTALFRISTFRGR